MIALILLNVVSAPVAFEHASVHIGDGTVRADTTVVIDGGKVVAVGGAIPAGATRIDATGKVLTPGLVEALCQLGLTEVGLENRTNDQSLNDGVLKPGFRAVEGLNPLTPRIAISREEGVTSAVVSPKGGIVYGTGAWFDLLGTLASRPDPTRPVAMFGGVGTSAAEGAGNARGGVWMKLRQLLDDARFYQKHRADIDRNAARGLIVSPMHLEALQPVLDGKLPLVLEADRASDVLAVLAFAAEEKVRVIVAGGAEAWKVRRELAQAKTPVILHPSALMPYSYESLLVRDDAATLLHAAGVPLVISAGDGDQNIRRLRQEAGIAVAYGLPHAEAVHAITGRAAEIYGKTDVGVIAAGKRANLVLWSGDPLQLSTVAEKVYIDGKEQPLGDDRQTQLVRRYLKK